MYRFTWCVSFTWRNISMRIVRYTTVHFDKIIRRSRWCTIALKKLFIKYITSLIYWWKINIFVRIKLTPPIKGNSIFNWPDFKTDFILDTASLRGLVTSSARLPWSIPSIPVRKSTMVKSTYSAGSSGSSNNSIFWIRIGVTFAAAANESLAWSLAVFKPPPMINWSLQPKYWKKN